jgi:sugar lactone lactonase YvrE
VARATEEERWDMREREVIAEGLGYLEAARWHDGALWFSDIKHRTVHRLRPGGELERVVEVPARPSGLGFDADGSLLLISMEDEKLLRLRGGALEEVADLGAVAMHPNDRAVDREGRAYISQFGYDLFGGGPPVGTSLVVRHPDGSVATCGEDLVFPNGVALSGDGRTLVTAESFHAPRTRLTAFDVEADGALTNQRVFAEFGGPDTDVLDGICLDAEGAVWVGCPFAGEFRRVARGGEVTDVIAIPPEGGNYCVDAVLGGDDLRTLYMLIADTDVERLGDDWDSSARIEVTRADVPGVELR